MVPKEKFLKSNKNRKKALVFTLLMVALPLIQFIIFWGYVNFDSIMMAFKNGNEWSLYQFEKLFRYDIDKILIYAKNSLINLAVSECITLPLVVVLSYLLYKKCYGSSLFRVLFFLPSLISAVIMANLFSSLVSPYGSDPGPIISLLQALGVPISEDILSLGLIDGDRAFPMVMVYCVWTGVGTNLVLLSGGLSRAPQELFEAARLDGAGMWSEFKDVVIPVLWPTITTLFIFNLAGCFTMYLPVMLLAENMDQATTVGYFIMIRTTEAGNNLSQLQYPAAVGLIFTAIIVPTILFVKWFFNKISDTLEF